MDLLGLGAAVAPGITKIVGDVLNRILPAEKMSEADKTRLAAEIQLEVMKADWTKAESEFKDRDSARVLAAADVARGNWVSNVLAATVRPVWGYGCFALVASVVVTPILNLPPVVVPTEVWDVIRTVVAFLFGGRTIERGISLWASKK